MPISKLLRLIYKVGWTGFEPATSCTPCKCATGLRHHPKGLQIYMKLALKIWFITAQK